MNNNKYILQCQEYIDNMKNALNENDLDKFNSMRNSLDECYELYKKDLSLTYECNNFGLANHIFEDALPRLFKTNKKAVKEYINTIKEDKNLLSQFQFIKALKSYKYDSDCDSYVNECLDLAVNNIDYKTVNESNDKLKHIIEKYEIKPSDLINEEDLKFYDNCNAILTKKKKLNNIIEMKDNIKLLSNYIESHKKGNIESINENNIYSMMDEFNNKYLSLLSEEEKSFVKELIDTKADAVNERKEKLFNKFKNECINIVNDLIKESDSSVKENLLEIKEQLLNKQFCQETLIKDMAKLLEIRDVLLNND